MYTSYIGKKFLQYYKEEYNKPDSYTAEQFFDEIMFPLFFDDTRHLMHVSNSPFFQKPSEKNILEYGSKTLAQYNHFKNKINEGIYGFEILVGFGSNDVTTETSGQLSNIKFNYTKEDIYCSWIGQALSVIVKGGIAILFDQKDILLQIQKGWEHYSKYLKQTPGLKDKQIETWNGNFLALTLNNKNTQFDYSKIKYGEVQKNIAILTLNWTEIFFEITKYYKTNDLLIYVYLLSQTNNTYGYFILKLHEINKLYEFRDKYFISEKDSVLSDYEISKLEPYYNFREACKMGVIGLRSFEPKGLRQYISKGSMAFSQGKSIDIEKENNYYVYKLWIITMLNKKELLELSKQFAKLLVESVDIINKNKKTTTAYDNFVNELFESTSPKQFINKINDKINDLMNEDNKDILHNLVEEVILMPKDNFPLFITLIKFEFNYLNKGVKK